MSPKKNNSSVSPVSTPAWRAGFLIYVHDLDWPSGATLNSDRINRTLKILSLNSMSPQFNSNNDSHEFPSITFLLPHKLPHLHTPTVILASSLQKDQPKLFTNLFMLLGQKVLPKDDDHGENRSLHLISIFTNQSHSSSSQNVLETEKYDRRKFLSRHSDLGEWLIFITMILWYTLMAIMKLGEWIRENRKLLWLSPTLLTDWLKRSGTKVIAIVVYRHKVCQPSSVHLLLQLLLF